jgi:hypothetical protein
MILLILMIYVASIVFKMGLGNAANPPVPGLPSREGSGGFTSIPMSMTWLFFAATLGDNILALYDWIVGESYIMAVAYMVMVFLCMFTLLNMLIGILCGVVDQVSQSSKEDVLIDYVKETLLKELNEISPGVQLVSRQQFKDLLENENVMAAFDDLDVDPDAFELIEGLVFDPDTPGGPEKELSFADFLKRVLSMRNGNVARVVDTIEVNKLIKKSSDDVIAMLDNNEAAQASKKKPSDAEPLVQLIEDRFGRALSSMKMEQTRNDAQLSSSIDAALDVRVQQFAKKLEMALIKKDLGWRCL